MSTIISMNFYMGKTVEQTCRTLDYAKSLGLDGVDLQLIPHTVDDSASVYSTNDEKTITAYFQSIRDYADSIGLCFTQTHGRIRAYNQDEAHNRTELASFRWDMLGSAVLGAPYCVIHNVHLGLDAPARQQRELNTRMMEDYMPFAPRYGVKIAMETLGDTHADDGRAGVDFFGALDEMLTAFEEIASKGDNRRWLCCCMDTGHTNKASRFPQQPSVAEYIRRMGSRIECLHLNDNNTLTDQHRAPLLGTVDWADTLSALKEIGYHGAYNMELKPNAFGDSPAVQKDYLTFAVTLMRDLLKE